MSSLDELSRDYEEHCDRPFPPGCRGVQEPVDLVSLDSFAAGCVSTFLENGGALDAKRVEVLTTCSRDLQRVVSALNGDEREYFGRLAHLAAGVLEFLGTRSRGT